jgi:hypothetical protein
VWEILAGVVSSRTSEVGRQQRQTPEESVSELRNSIKHKDLTCALCSVTHIHFGSELNRDFECAALAGGKKM